MVTSEQNPSGILISEPYKIRKWVVEKFDGISPGLLSSPNSCLSECLKIEKKPTGNLTVTGNV